MTPFTWAAPRLHLPGAAALGRDCNQKKIYARPTLGSNENFLLRQPGEPDTSVGVYPDSHDWEEDLYVAEHGIVDKCHCLRRSRVRKEGRAPVMTICARSRLRSAGSAGRGQAGFSRRHGKEPGLKPLDSERPRALPAADLLTAGPKEVTPGTVPVARTARRPPGVIHTDFERGSFALEVIACADYVAAKASRARKKPGRCRLEEKDYVVRDGDVIYFRFNV